MKGARHGLGDNPPTPALLWPPATRSTISALIVSFLIYVFPHYFPQEDFECGVCTSGSSCELGWGAKVDDVDKNPFALEVQTVKVDHVDKNHYA